MRKCFVVFLLSVATVTALADTPPPLSNPRLLLVGDSWAMFLSAFRSFPRAFEERELPTPGIVPLYWPGSEASDWNAFFPKLVLAWTLRRHPSLEVAVVSLGGNDLLGDYNTGLTAQDQDALYDRIRTDLEAVVTFLLSQKADLQIVLCGYDYMNFVESVKNTLFDAYRRTWIEAGKPNAEEVNVVLIRLATIQQDIADTYDRVTFVNNFGLMQWAYGYPAVALPPKTVPLPALRIEDGVPLGGDHRLPSPPEAMLSVWFFVDAIHLSPNGYRLLAGNVIDRALAPILYPEKTLTPQPQFKTLRAFPRRQVYPQVLHQRPSTAQCATSE